MAPKLWRAHSAAAHLSSRHSPKCYNTRLVSTALHFYQNKQLELYASKTAQRLTLRQLIFFGRSMNEDRLIKSANYVRTELPVRIAHRLRDMQALPYIVVTQEEVSNVYELYWAAFEKIRRFPQITTMTENEAFCVFLKGLLDEHGAVIPRLSLGLSLSSPHLSPDRLDTFMKRMLVSRISRRVLVEHHVALSNSHATQGDQNLTDGPVGIIHTGLKVKESIEKCASLLKARPYSVVSVGKEGPEKVNVECPDVIVDGHDDTRFAYIREHFEYIIFELLKNAMHATSFRHQGNKNVPIRATIAAGKDDIQVRISDQGGGLLNPHVNLPADLFSFSHIRNTTRMEDSRIGALRTVSSKGMQATVEEQVTRWQGYDGNGDDPEKTAGVGPHLRIGVGLPMSNIFATYFGGSLELVSLDGWGTDVYLRLPKLGTKLEEIEF